MRNDRRVAIATLAVSVFLLLGIAPCRPVPPVGCTLGKSWANSDAYLASTARHAEARAAASNENAIFVGGFESEVDDFVAGARWTVRRSKDRGGTWETVDQVASEARSSANGIATDPLTGAVYVAGAVTDSSGSFWTVRKSTDDGATWTVIDRFRDSGHPAAALAVAVGPDGKVYVAGSSFNWAPTPDTPGLSHWLVRRSTDGGATWATVDNWIVPGKTTEAYGIAVAPTGRVFASGRFNGPGQGVWLVRSSADGAGAWSNVDEFQLALESDGLAFSVAAREDGNVYVAGFSGGPEGVQHWLVRRAKQSAPLDWTTLDDFVSPTSDGSPARNAWAMGLGFARGGRLFATGWADVAVSDGTSEAFTTRTGTGTPSTFKISDQVAPGLGAGYHEGRAIARGPQDDLFAAGSFTVRDKTYWFVRRLKCE